MKKIFLLVLCLLSITGCGKTSLSEPADELHLKYDGYESRKILVGDEIKPGNITISVNETKSQKFYIFLIQPDSINYFSNKDNKFKPFSWDDSQWMRDIETKVNNGYTMTLPESIPDNSVISIGVMHPFAHGYIPEAARDRGFDINVISDGSEEYDDSYVTNGGRSVIKMDLNRNLDFSGNYSTPINNQSLVVGEDISGGYMSITCLESETDSCEVLASASKRVATDLTFSDPLYIPLGKIKVGETYVCLSPLTNGMILTFNPSISSPKNHPDMQSNLNQKIKIKMLSELPPEEENTEDSNN